MADNGQIKHSNKADVDADDNLKIDSISTSITKVSYTSVSAPDHDISATWSYSFIPFAEIIVPRVSLGDANNL